MRITLTQTVLCTTMCGPHYFASEISKDISETKDAKYYWENGDPKYDSKNAVYDAFEPDDATMTCSNDKHLTPFNKQFRGVNLGGMLVLEPWITPTLFYQFLGTQERFGDQAPEKTGMDTYTFCTALGKEEANRQLRIHYANWVTEEDIKKLHEVGVNSLRVPVGDWMFAPYEPYIGCTDGALEELDRVLDLAHKYKMDVLLDIHALKDSQNGFDNSGQARNVKWTSVASTQPVFSTTFEHWPIRMAEWAGTYDPVNHNYSFINYANLMHSLSAVTVMVERYAKHPAIMGMEPINEPWELTPVDVLKKFYWKSYKRMKAIAPSWKFVMHDSFRFAVNMWAGFMKGCPDIAIDTHIYQAWNNPGTKEDFYSNSCQQKYTISAMENGFMPVIVGEWSVATDNCQMWLNGFNDNLPGFPKVVCKLEKCPVHSTYLGKNFPGTPLDLTRPIQGPYGTGTSGPSFGLCPVTSDNAFHQENDLDMTRLLLYKRLNAWSVGHGWYFWNFKAEIDYKWSFLALIEKGLLPRNVSAYGLDEGILEVCEKEDKGDFVCRAKRGVKDYELRNGLKFACNAPGMDCSSMNATYPTLLQRCDWAYNEYWHQHRQEGATCDFGGAGHLLAIEARKEPKETKALNVSTSVVEEHHKRTYSGVIAMSVGGVALCLFATGFVLYRWRQHRLRRENYAPIGRGL